MSGEFLVLVLLRQTHLGNDFAHLGDTFIGMSGIRLRSTDKPHSEWNGPDLAAVHFAGNLFVFQSMPIIIGRRDWENVQSAVDEYNASDGGRLYAARLVEDVPDHMADGCAKG